MASEPSVNIGSMARQWPTASSIPGDRERKLGTCGSSCIEVPMPWPDVLADDAEAARAGDILDRGRDGADPVARHGGRDPRHEREPGRLHQADRRRAAGRVAAADEAAGAVAMPAVVDGPHVDRDDLAGPDLPVARDAVDDLGVERDAGRGRVRVRVPRVVAPPAEVAQERGDAPGARMWRSARRSSSAVETPGLRFSSTRARTSATIRPADRIFAISAFDLRVIMLSRLPAPRWRRGARRPRPARRRWRRPPRRSPAGRRRSRACRRRGSAR